MKLRTTYNSIRIRIRKSELSILRNQGKVTESIRFPTGVIFHFGITIQKDTNKIVTTLEENYLEITLPQDIAENWINTNEVGIESFIDLPGNEKLHLLIEKDFPCLDRPEENKADTFWELAPDQPDPC